ncbi:MAG: flagellar biosynthetic protein FliR [Candidatus Schekmanbacteria bacterium]|nr:MAG: flagellar biosynthetic protein FliR [Candidatus Schekmanbacteria bacterium]
MNLFYIDIEKVQFFLLIFFRIIAIFIIVPVFGDRATPSLLKAGFAAAISFIIFPIVSTNIHHSLNIHNIYELTVLIVKELALGLSTGFIIRLIFAGIDFAAQIAGFQMGFGIVNVFDPHFEEQMSIIAKFQNIFAVLIFLAINAHHYIIKAITESFEIIPPAGINFSGKITAFMITVSSEIFTLAIKISAPVVATLLISNIIFGILVRTVPQINIFIVTFPLLIGIGLVVLGISMPYIYQIFKSSFTEMDIKMLRLLRLF